MKQKLSVTVETALIQKLKHSVKGGAFRNKSHLVEFALNKFFEENKWEK